MCSDSYKTCIDSSKNLVTWCNKLHLKLWHKQKYFKHGGSSKKFTRFLPGDALQMCFSTEDLNNQHSLKVPFYKSQLASFFFWQQSVSLSCRWTPRKWETSILYFLAFCVAQASAFHWYVSCWLGTLINMKRSTLPALFVDFCASLLSSFQVTIQNTLKQRSSYLIIHYSTHNNKCDWTKSFLCLIHQESSYLSFHTAASAVFFYGGMLFFWLQLFLIYRT